jgi:hypothetical protein
VPNSTKPSRVALAAVIETTSANVFSHAVCPESSTLATHP